MTLNTVPTTCVPVSLKVIIGIPASETLVLAQFRFLQRYLFADRFAIHINLRKWAATYAALIRSDYWRLSVTVFAHVAPIGWVGVLARVKKN